MSYKVIYIEDEEHLASIVKETMELKGYTVLHHTNGLKILDMMHEFNPDIFILDVMLPYVDGFSIGNTIRKVHPTIPIIYLTAKSQTSDVLSGFSSGGNDYLKKPFSMEELMARMENLILMGKRVLNNSATNIEAKRTLTLGSFTYCSEKMELINKDKEVIKLSNRESEIMNIFCLHPNETIDRRELMTIVWGDDSYFISRNLDVYIRRLRDYFTKGEGVEIITLKGKGYLFSVG